MNLKSTTRSRDFMLMLDRFISGTRRDGSSSSGEASGQNVPSHRRLPHSEQVNTALKATRNQYAEMVCRTIIKRPKAYFQSCWFLDIHFFSVNSRFSMDRNYLLNNNNDALKTTIELCFAVVCVLKTQFYRKCLYWQNYSLVLWSTEAGQKKAGFYILCVGI